MRLSVKSTVLTLGLTSAVLAATVTPAEAAVPYRNWVQYGRNVVGVTWYPNGDYFRIWNNASGSYSSGWTEWNYVGVKDKWHRVGNVGARSNAIYTKNLSERRQIYFRACFWDGGLIHCSKAVRFRVSGRNP
ncbi:hypothetical protein [Actinomadura kijaniata]|uniref:hypothetical protein n=1 Tax=Actinomadura kijaniata TaxID=46161 RepID=UPI00082B1068|nr:hypothetical protein [Actinomadura kijaniata]